MRKRKRKIVDLRFPELGVDDCSQKEDWMKEMMKEVEKVAKAEKEGETERAAWLL